MRAEDELLLELCLGSPDPLRVRNLAQAESLDWEYFLQIGSRNMVRLFTLSRLEEIVPLWELDSLLPGYLFMDEQRCRERREMMRSELDRIGSKLRGAGLEFILMKGLSLNYSELREFGDMDLLVRTEHALDSVQLLGELDYVFEGSPLISRERRTDQGGIESQLDWNNQYEVVNQSNQLLVELHTNLFHRKGVYVEDLDRLWQGIGRYWEDAREDPQLGCQVFSNEGLVLLMCLHVAIKRSPGRNQFCLRNLVDIDQSCADGLDWSVLARDAKSFGVAPLVYFALCLSRDHLGTPLPSKPMEDLKGACSFVQLRLCDLHLGCVSGFNGSAPLAALAYRVASPFVFGRRWSDRFKWLLLIPVLFPSRFDLARQFKLEEDSLLVYPCYLLNPLRRLYGALTRLARI